jgi:hypothetical protein
MRGSYAVIKKVTIMATAREPMDAAVCEACTRYRMHSQRERERQKERKRERERERESKRERERDSLIHSSHIHTRTTHAYMSFHPSVHLDLSIFALI